MNRSGVTQTETVVRHMEVLYFMLTEGITGMVRIKRKPCRTAESGIGVFVFIHRRICITGKVRVL